MDWVGFGGTQQTSGGWIGWEGGRAGLNWVGGRTGGDWVRCMGRRTEVRCVGKTG